MLVSSLEAVVEAEVVLTDNVSTKILTNMVV
jgi:hypothetical protein